MSVEEDPWIAEMRLKWFEEEYLPRDHAEWAANFEAGFMSWDWDIWSTFLLAGGIAVVWVALMILTLLYSTIPNLHLRLTGMRYLPIMPAYVLACLIVGLWGHAVVFLGGPIAYLMYEHLDPSYFARMEGFTDRYLNIWGVLFY